MADHESENENERLLVGVEASHDEENDMPKPPYISATKVVRWSTVFLSVVVCALTLTVTILLLLADKHINSGPDFPYLFRTPRYMKDLGICVVVTFLMTFFTTIIDTFFYFPSLINIPANITLATVVIYYSDRLTRWGWPMDQICYVPQPTPGPPWHRMPETPECQHFRWILRRLVRASASLSIAAGLFLIALVLVRIFKILQSIDLKQGTWTSQSLFPRYEVTLKVVKRQTSGYEQVPGGPD